MTAPKGPFTKIGPGIYWAEKSKRAVFVASELLTYFEVEDTPANRAWILLEMRKLAKQQGMKITHRGPGSATWREDAEN